ncbi:class I adenylate-forming enzyme family protein [Bradyrhizobium yuanmingense]|uniref:class I adenylate-forming enzyme family protein n=1 Tax=Bradyrhizobium yuanmingense TaxID=108015 RepID=UPI0023B94499|nr:AMP-binding protein [Bradyrhizobium yuanmingense]MDF0493000.1 AMP-binding protein [Bradyrhizobium yuanmingense]
MNLSTLIERNAAFEGDKAAIHFEGTTLSYVAFLRRIEQAARALKTRLGVERGDRIAILSLNRPDYLVLLYACARVGAILVPLNWRLAIAEQLFILSDAGIKVLVLEQAFQGILPPVAEQLPFAAIIGLDFDPVGGSKWCELLEEARGDDSNAYVDLSCPLLIVYTSGTTGRPKGAVLRQEALFWNGVMSRHMHELSPTDHILSVLPLFHVGGLNILTTPALHYGATVTLHSRFTPEATLAAFERDRPTLTVLVPATIQALADHPRWPRVDVCSLKAISTGSTMVPRHVIGQLAERGITVLQVYGSTETSPIALYTRLRGDLTRDGSTGRAGVCCEAAITNDAGDKLPPGTAGEIAVRGPNLFCEYWNNQHATREVLRNGWYYTGDIGRSDADGYFWVLDRKKNMIISGGENIYPAEVERVLTEHPDVAECAVVGRPDPRWDEVPVAYVVKQPGARIEADVLIEYVRTQLARFKAPREIIFTDELPRTELGKIQHFKLKDLDARSGNHTEAN